MSSTTDLNNITRRFLLGESRTEPSMASYIRSLEETLSNFSPKTGRERARLEMAMEQVRAIRRHHKRLVEENRKLEEKLSLLEEKLLEEGE